MHPVPHTICAVLRPADERGQGVSERQRPGRGQRGGGLGVDEVVVEPGQLPRRFLEEGDAPVHDLEGEIRESDRGPVNVVDPVMPELHRPERQRLVHGDDLDPQLPGPFEDREGDLGVVHQPARYLLSRPAVGVELEPGRVAEQFNLLLERTKSGMKFTVVLELADRIVPIRFTISGVLSARAPSSPSWRSARTPGRPAVLSVDSTNPQPGAEPDEPPGRSARSPRPGTR
jgi:hypothetical protein